MPDLHSQVEELITKLNRRFVCSSSLRSFECSVALLCLFGGILSSLIPQIGTILRILLEIVYELSVEVMRKLGEINCLKRVEVLKSKYW
jgi:hypothetical protein